MKTALTLSMVLLAILALAILAVIDSRETVTTAEALKIAPHCLTQASTDTEAWEQTPDACRGTADNYVRYSSHCIERMHRTRRALHAMMYVLEEKILSAASRKMHFTPEGGPLVLKSIKPTAEKGLDGILYLHGRPDELACSAPLEDALRIDLEYEYYPEASHPTTVIRRLKCTARGGAKCVQERIIQPQRLSVPIGMPLGLSF